MRITNTPIARTPMLHVSLYARSLRNAMSEMEDNVMQKVGRVRTRRRRPMNYTRHENSTRVNNVKRLGQRATHNESLQVNPIKTRL